MAIAATTNSDGLSTDVNGDGKNDIVVADEGTGQIGVLLNSGTGTFPATKAYSAGNSPESVALADLVAGHTSSNILDAAVANFSGGVSVLPNGAPPTDGTGVYLKQTSYSSYPKCGGDDFSLPG